MEQQGIGSWREKAEAFSTARSKDALQKRWARHLSPFPSPKINEWSAEELGMLETLVAEEGSGDWEKKAQALGTGRTAKSLANKWSRRSQAAKPSPKPEMPRDSRH